MNIFNISSGVSVGEFAPDVDETYGLFKNGLFKKTKNQIGTFTHKVSEVPETMGIEAVCEVSFERDETIPKIPYQVFQSILKFYKDVYKDIKSEVYTLVVWDKEAKDFFIHVPEQQVSGATVKYTNNVEIYNNPKYLVYCDFHSHNTMNAFFSSVDTKDEVAGRYFGVIGKIFEELPAMALKASFNRQGVLLGYHDLFDIETEKLHETSNYYLDYEALKDRIKERVYTYPSYAGFPKANKAKPVTTYTKPKNITVNSKTKTKGYNNYNRYSDPDLYSDYEDDEAWANLQNEIGLDEDFQLIDFLNETYNLSKDTMFEQNPIELSEFMYDFKTIFKDSKNTVLPEKNIINIFQSLFDLILSYNDVELDAFNAVIQEIKTVYAKCLLKEELGVNAPTSTQPQINLLPNLTK